VSRKSTPFKLFIAAYVLLVASLVYERFEERLATAIARRLEGVIAFGFAGVHDHLDAAGNPAPPSAPRSRRDAK
jgi:hypothetical protein